MSQGSSNDATRGAAAGGTKDAKDAQNQKDEDITASPAPPGSTTATPKMLSVVQDVYESDSDSESQKKKLPKRMHTNFLCSIY